MQASLRNNPNTYQFPTAHQYPVNYHQNTFTQLNNNNNNQHHLLHLSHETVQTSDACAQEAQQQQQQQLHARLYGDSAAQQQHCLELGPAAAAAAANPAPAILHHTNHEQQQQQPINQDHHHHHLSSASAQQPSDGDENQYFSPQFAQPHYEHYAQRTIGGPHEQLYAHQQQLYACYTDQTAVAKTSPEQQQQQHLYGELYATQQQANQMESGQTGAVFYSDQQQMAEPVAVASTTPISYCQQAYDTQAADGCQMLIGNVDNHSHQAQVSTYHTLNVLELSQDEGRGHALPGESLEQADAAAAVAAAALETEENKYIISDNYPEQPPAPGASAYHILEPRDLNHLAQANADEQMSCRQPVASTASYYHADQHQPQQQLLGLAEVQSSIQSNSPAHFAPTTSFVDEQTTTTQQQQQPTLPLPLTMGKQTLDETPVLYESFGRHQNDISASSACSNYSSSSGLAESVDSTLTRDERKAREANIPLSYSDIVDLSIDQFNEHISKFSFTEAQLTLMKDIRRRGKNKVAAQTCRKRKMEQIGELQLEVNHLIERKMALSYQRSGLQSEHERLLKNYDRAYAIVKRYLTSKAESSDAQAQQQQHHQQQQVAATSEEQHGGGTGTIRGLLAI